jgi:hypothetical protein
MNTSNIIQMLGLISTNRGTSEALTRREAEAVRAAIDKLHYFDSLLQFAKHAYLDLKGLMPEVEPSGDRQHTGWNTIEEPEFIIELYDPGFVKTK